MAISPKFVSRSQDLCGITTSGTAPDASTGTRYRSVVGVLAMAWMVLSTTTPRAQADTTPPNLVGRSPAAGATGVSALVNVRAVFSEAIQAPTLSMVLRNASNQLVASAVAYDPATATATLNPDAELAGNQQFTVTVASGRDLAGNVMATESWSFTTAPSQFVDQQLPQAGLTDPTVIQFATDGRLFVAQKDGRIWVYDSLSDVTPTLVADLSLSVYNFWDRGLLGMTLHPDFPTMPYAYVLYTYDAVPGGTAPRWGLSPYINEGCPNPPGATGNGCVVTGRLSRLDIGNASLWPLDHNDEQPLVTDWPQQFPSHSTGALVFGSDGALYASAGDGASFNYADYGQTASSPSLGDPVDEGGSLRSQDLRTGGDPVTLDGAIIRIDPDTGAALPDNPRYGSDTDPNGRRIVAHGLRNPFRITVRPGTREIWVGDVGWGTTEEINRLVDPIDATEDNFGWPCYEGTPRQGGFDSANLPVCENLYTAGDTAVVAPYFAYDHGDTLQGCGPGSSSIAGLAFYPAPGGGYPSSYNGALFFADYSRSCIWAMRVGTNGLPNPGDVVQVQKNGAGPVNLVIGPGNDVFYPGFNDDRIHRLSYAGNLPPSAALTANTTSGLAPLSVSYSATGSSDPEGDALVYAWDLDADGAFDDGSGAVAQWTYTTAGAFNVRVLVTDGAGLSDVAGVTILVNNSRPIPVIDTPTAQATWRVGDLISFTGHATDPDETGPLPAAALSWELVIHHCPSNCHTHPLQSFTGVASGSFSAPDHEYPSFLELRLTATDATGLQSSTSVELQPQTVALTLQTNPTGLELGVNAATAVAPFSRAVIVGSSNSLSAPLQQVLGGTTYQFASWSDGLSANHNVIAPAVPTTLTATYVATGPPPDLVAAFGMNESSGTTVSDWTGKGHTGTVSGAAWTTAGRFGGALSFDGVNDWVTVADAADLDLTTGLTVEAWVYPTVSGGGSWRNVLIKERTGGEVYNLYANADTNTPATYVVTAGNPTAALDARGNSALPLDTWSHLTVTFDNATLRLYVNGVQVGSRTVAGPLLTSTGALRLGGNSVWGEYFAGRLDEVRIYKRALTVSEIQADMNAAVGGVDTVAPVLSGGAPSGVLTAGTTATTMSVATNENAICRYATTAGVAYGSMPSTFTTTGAVAHATTVTGLVNGGSYSFYVRCADVSGNATTSDYLIAFAVAQPVVDTTPPAVAIGSPADLSSVAGVITIVATASDNVGVAGVQFFVDGGNLSAEVLVPPYQVTWDTSSTALGPHVLTARARDAAGNTTLSVPITVNVVLNQVVTASPTSAAVLTGTLSSGTVAALVSDDNVYYAVASTTSGTRTAAWYGAFAGVTNNLSNLRINYKGNNSGNCTQTIAVWNWLTSSWAQLDSRTVGSTEVAINNLTPAGTLADYVSGESGSGELRVRVQCTANANRTSRGDLMNIVYDQPVGPDTTPPVRSNGAPTGTLPSGTTQTTISLTTNENATCRFGPTPGTGYASLPSIFSATGGVSHSSSLTGLTDGASYAAYVRCQDVSGNANQTDFGISFSVALPDLTPPTVAISSPVDGATVSGVVTIAATASDNVGVVGVQFFLAGAPLGAEDTTSPYSIAWSSTAVVNGGPYALSARARDAYGNQTTSVQVNVSVNNTVLPGLIAAYNFDAGTGTVLTDNSGLGHPGTISGATWTTQGRFGQALTFDGINDWVTVADASDLDLTSGMTLEAWVYPTALGNASWRNVLIKERPSGEVYNLYANADTNAPTAFVVRAAQPDVALDARGTSQLPLNTWSHLTVTYDNATLRLYVGGVQVGTRAGAGPLLTSSGVLRIGGNSPWGEYFAGRIDNVRIYNRALTPTEIQSDMSTPIQP